ncbi:MAG: dephospho-CoA kinase [Chloroflexi bacterium]|nr:dephospho-CoA kinase [Chloroflexota bacterium]
MSSWPGKYVIGLTGNIATGKTVVRRMLEHLGAYGIDADALAHRAIARDAPGYKPVVDTFGRWILGPDLQIDRSRLGTIVFSNPEALTLLEGIVHPLVRQAIDVIVKRSTQPVAVIEAIKLLETDLHKSCDSLWVTFAPQMVQMARLMDNRKMPESEARQRLTVQPPQEQKINQANVVIRNGGSFEETWRQVTAAWQRLPPIAETAPVPPKTTSRGEWTIERGKPRHSEEIAALITRLGVNGKVVSKNDVMAAFGEKAFMLLQRNNQLVGVIGWQVENLVARTTDVYLEANIQVEEALPVLIAEMEHASKDLQSEASLMFVSPKLARLDGMWKELGYEQRTPQSLNVQAWQEAAVESMPQGSVLHFKQLRQDRILRPI